MKTKDHANTRQKMRRQEQPALQVQVIPAPTIFWHPSIALERLIADFAEYQDSIIVS